MSEIAKAKSKVRKYHTKPGNRRYNLQINLKGFLCSCNNREKDCIRETYNILNEYADKLNPIASNDDSKTEAEEDVLDSLNKEVSLLKNENSADKSRFQVLESGAKNFLFIRTTLENPVQLAETIIKDIQETKSQKTKFLLRLIPVEVTCKANMQDIDKAFTALAEKYFREAALTFSVVYNHRNNNSLVRDDVIKMLADKVLKTRSDHKVDLKAAEVSVICEIIKGFAFLSVVPNYVKYKKYNLLTASQQTGE